MFKRSENPALFDEVLNKCIFDNPNCGLDWGDNEIGDEILATVTSLSIKPNERVDITSLKGLEKLPNLTSFSCVGNSMIKYSHIREKWQNKLSNLNEQEREELKKDIDFIKRDLDAGQLTDISSLQECKNLKFLDLSSQRHIEEISVTGMPNLSELSMRGCTSLQAIIGFDKLNISSDKDSKFDFTGCDSLYDIYSADQSFNNFARLNSNSKVFFPTTAFCYFLHNNPSLATNINFYSNNINYSEQTVNSKYDVLKSQVDLSPSQMQISKSYVDKIICAVCDVSQNNIVNSSQLYRYLCEFVKYDDKGLEQEKNSGIDYSKDSLTNAMRSSFTALWEQKAVCVGISNLFNFMLSDLGVFAKPVSCNLQEDRVKNLDQDTLEYIVKPNHRISKIEIDGHSYYCDPTNDLGNEKSDFFCLNRQQMSEFVVLQAGEKADSEAPSYQISLLDHGLLTTGPRCRELKEAVLQHLNEKSESVDEESVSQIEPVGPTAEETVSENQIINNENARSPVAIPDDLCVRYGEKYDLNAIAEEENAKEIFSDLSAFDNLEKGNLPVQEKINDDVPVEILDGNN